MQVEFYITSAWHYKPPTSYQQNINIETIYGCERAWTISFAHLYIPKIDLSVWFYSDFFSFDLEILEAIPPHILGDPQSTPMLTSKKAQTIFVLLLLLLLLLLLFNKNCRGCAPPDKFPGVLHPQHPPSPRGLTHKHVWRKNPKLIPST